MTNTDGLNTQDHDLLITLRTEFSTFTRQYALDIKELKDGYSLKIADHELRLNKLESLALETDAANSYKDFLRVKQEVHDFKTTAAVWRVVAGAVGGFILWLLIQAPNWIKIWIK